MNLNTLDDFQRDIIFERANTPFSPVVLSGFVKVNSVKEFKERWGLTLEEIAYALSAKTDDGFAGPTGATVSRWVNYGKAPGSALVCIAELNFKWINRLCQLNVQAFLEQEASTRRRLPADHLFFEKIVYKYLNGDLPNISKIVVPREK